MNLAENTLVYRMPLEMHGLLRFNLRQKRGAPTFTYGTGKGRLTVHLKTTHQKIRNYPVQENLKAFR
jgi:hypothetical protein